MTCYQRLCVYVCMCVHRFDVDFDGLFVSNGPGNPEMCVQTVEELRLVLAREPTKPVFGICLGHQLLSLAAGATTYKMKSVSKHFCSLHQF